MKNIAIIGSETIFNLKEITKQVEANFTLISNKKISDIESFANSENLTFQYIELENLENFINQNNFDLIIINNLIGNFPTEIAENKNIINIHPSLLPAFKSINAIKDAYVEGVKVSGVTIHQVEKNNFFGKIIAQYPILLTNSMHYDEFENEILALEEKLYPIVIEKILQDKVFDFSDLLGGCSNHSGDSCGGNCGGCH